MIKKALMCDKHNSIYEEGQVCCFCQPRTRVALCGVDCRPGDEVCNNYCNMAAVKGPMQETPPMVLRKTTLCLTCRGEFTDKDSADVNACPRCGSDSVPADLTTMVELKITTHELRILSMWAMNYAEHIKGGVQNDPTVTVQGILDALRRQKPDLPPLTMREEMKGLANAYGKVEYLHDGVLEEIKPETKH